LRILQLEHNQLKNEEDDIRGRRIQIHCTIRSIRRGKVCRTHLFILEEINQLYRTTTREEDYVNPTADGVLSWRSITSCMSNLNIGLENWQQRLHEVSTRICARIARAIRWVGTEIREPPNFHGVNELEIFLTRYKDKVLEN
jgi:hypothetical protein